jgi:integrase
MAAEQKVLVYSLGLPNPETPKAKRRYRVKWEVDGRHKTRSFRTKEQAERLRSTLQQAIRDGLRFDAETSEPADWHRTSTTWWSWSSEWYALKWPDWAGKSRKSGAEPLVAITPHLVRDRAPELDFDLSSWLWQVGYRPNLADEARAGRELAWLQRWSLPLDEIDPGTLERALTAATTRQDGRRMAATSVKKRRDLINAVFAAAERRELIDRNPMRRIVWRAPSRSIEVDITTVPSTADVLRAVELAADQTGYGAHYAALYVLVGLAGLRPSEAAGLLVADLELPSTGWGTARVRGATTSPGSRYTDDGEAREDKGLKHRPESSSRTVPLPHRGRPPSGSSRQVATAGRAGTAERQWSTGHG